MNSYQATFQGYSGMDFLVEASDPESALSNAQEMAKTIWVLRDKTHLLRVELYEPQDTPEVQMLTQEDRIQAASERSVIENDKQKQHDKEYLKRLEEKFASTGFEEDGE